MRAPQAREGAHVAGGADTWLAETLAGVTSMSCVRLLAVFAFGLLRAVAVVELDVLEVLPLENERPEFVGGLGRAGRPERDTFVLWRQLPTSKLVGLSVGLPSFALPVRKPHAPDFLIRGFLRWLLCRESELLVRCPLTPWLADGQPGPPTACGPVGRLFAFDSESHQASALPPTAKAIDFHAVTSDCRRRHVRRRA